MLQPNEITKCVDTGLQTAHFKYHDGIKVAKKKKLKQTTEFSNVRKGTHFIVSCGNVMIKVTSLDYPNIKRRKF